MYLPIRWRQTSLSQIVGYYDIIASDSMIHLTLMVREEAHENPVKETCGDERVYVADGEASEVVSINLLTTLCVT